MTTARGKAMEYVINERRVKVRSGITGYLLFDAAIKTCKGCDRRFVTKTWADSIDNLYGERIERFLNKKHIKVCRTKQTCSDCVQKAMTAPSLA